MTSSRNSMPSGMLGERAQGRAPPGKDARREQGDITSKPDANPTMNTANTRNSEHVQGASVRPWNARPAAVQPVSVPGYQALTGPHAARMLSRLEGRTR